MEKYKLTNEKFTSASGKVLYRIQAVREISQRGRIVKKGTLGGYVESPANLSQEGEAWLADKAMSIGKTIIEGDAWVGGNAVIWGDSVITDEAEVWGDTFIESSTIGGECKVKDQAHVKDATLSGAVILQNEVQVKKTTIEGTVNVMGTSRISGSTINGKDIIVKEKAYIYSSDIGGVSTHDTPKIIVIGGNSRLVHIQIFGENIVITGDAKLGKGTLLIGKKILISDHADIAGNVEVLSDVSISELAFIRNYSYMPLHLDEIQINGDTVIEKN